MNPPPAKRSAHTSALGRRLGSPHASGFFRRTALSACWPGLICSRGRSTAWSETATAVESSSNSSNLLTPLIRPAPQSNWFSTIIPRTPREKPKLGWPLDRPAVSSSPSHPSRLLAQPHRGLLLQVRPLGPAPHQGWVEAGAQGAHHGRYRRHQSLPCH